MSKTIEVSKKELALVLAAVFDCFTEEEAVQDGVEPRRVKVQIHIYVEDLDPQPHR